MDKYIKQALKITTLIFLSAVGLISLAGFTTATPYYYARCTRLRHDAWGYGTMWMLRCSMWAYYATSGGYDIESWSTAGSHAQVMYPDIWTTFGYVSYGVTKEQKPNGYYSWVYHKNSAHFETCDGHTHIKAYCECKVKEDYILEWDIWWTQYYGDFTWMQADNILLGSH